jgi:hypothetical protein
MRLDVAQCCPPAYATTSPACRTKARARRGWVPTVATRVRLQPDPLRPPRGGDSGAGCGDGALPTAGCSSCRRFSWSITRGQPEGPPRCCPCPPLPGVLGASNRVHGAWALLLHASGSVGRGLFSWLGRWTARSFVYDHAFSRGDWDVQCQWSPAVWRLREIVNDDYDDDWRSYSVSACGWWGGRGDDCRYAEALARAMADSRRWGQEPGAAKWAIQGIQGIQRMGCPLY